ncbi:TPA: erm Leader peptide [Staphylococcus aureus]|nr:erm Leader peptide [Staphylococcus aureus]
MTYGSIIAIACELFVIFFIPYMEKNNKKKK